MLARRARASAGSARRHGPSRSTTSTSRRPAGRWARRTTTRRPGPSSTAGMPGRRPLPARRHGRRTCSPNSNAGWPRPSSTPSIRATTATSRRRRCSCRSRAKCSPRSPTRASTSGMPGPTGAFVEEEVVRWLAELVGYGPDSFGLLTSGGVMANFMAMALARDIHLPKVCGLDRPPRGRDLEGVRVYTSDQTHFSIARALDELGFPRDTLVVIAADEQFRLRGAPVADGDRQRPGCRADAARDLGGGGVHEHRRGGRALRAGRRGRAGGPVVPRRCGVRRGGAPLREAGGPGPRPAPCALGDRRSAQVVLPGLRHRRAAGPRRQPPRADVRRPAA